MATPLPKERHFSGKCAFDIAYGNWDKAFSALPRYMAALQYFNTGTVVEWKFERNLGISKFIFRYVFWAFKPAIDSFVYCWPIISIDGTHVYGKYAIKMMIVVAIDTNGSIFSLTFVICANESQETWTYSVQTLDAWKEQYVYHRYCVRHLKDNYQRACPNKSLHDLMWMAAINHQECKFKRRMELIRQEDPEAYHWLMQHELDK
ncbi:uncharacterized protein [Nicotiana tomentosiformis]|uniref:uncharacterized protein n=1 Tax=Nicotiana tomentosiformis TaxID=4098 RepID=UPI00388CA467